MKKNQRMFAMLLALGACAPAQSQEQPVAPNTIAVHTRDYVFYQMPDTIPAGATTIRLINDGPELHHVWLVRLEEGKTKADFAAAMQHGHQMPSWAVDVGGPNTPVPGEESSATVVLEAGNYIVMCVIPSSDGKPHVMKGMSRELTVVPNAKPAPLPPADIVLTLNDYNFTFDKPVTAGRRTIRIENAAQQSHEAILVQLAPGKTAQDVMAWLLKPEGPPPGKPIGGTTGFARGEVNLITHNFMPGSYALICFVPDAKDGKPHAEHGMFTEFDVE